MKVLFLLHETNIHSGAWKSIYPLLLGLQKKNVILKVITPNKRGCYQILKTRNIDVTSVLSTSFRRYYNEPLNRKIYLSLKYFLLLFNQIFWFIRVFYMIKRFKPDIIHTNSSIFRNGYYIAKGLKIPHVWHIREYGYKDFNLKTQKTDQLISQGYSNLIFITKGIYESRCPLIYLSCTSYGIARQIYNPIIDIVRPINNKLTNESNSKYFLYVGSLKSGKGIKDLLKGWNKYKDKNSDNKIKLLIAGGSKDDLKSWNSFIRTHHTAIQSSIVFLGKVDNVIELMIHAEAVIVPSYFEGFGRVLSEAMSCKTLTIGRNTAGIKEQYDNGLNLYNEEIGFRFSSSEELAEILYEFHRIPNEIRNRMTEYAFETVKLLYNTQKHIDSVYELYNDILKKKL